MQAVFSLQGAPRLVVTPFTRSIMRKLMLLEGLTLGQQRDVALTVTWAQMCAQDSARVGEI